jgi:quinol monooxygenase YgiN
MWDIGEATSLGKGIQSFFRAGQFAFHPHLAGETGLRLLASAGVLTIHGPLNLSHEGIETSIEAYCRITVRAAWRRQSPALRCVEKWIRRPGGSLTADWHVNSDESLCYVLDREWADQIKAIEDQYNAEAAIAAAAFITINNARWLLYRHLEGYRRKLRRWPPDWPQWDHGFRGLMAYVRQITRKR